MCINISLSLYIYCSLIHVTSQSRQDCWTGISSNCNKCKRTVAVEVPFFFLAAAVAACCCSSPCEFGWVEVPHVHAPCIGIRWPASSPGTVYLWAFGAILVDFSGICNKSLDFDRYCRRRIANHAGAAAGPRSVLYDTDKGIQAQQCSLT